MPHSFAAQYFFPETLNILANSKIYAILMFTMHLLASKREISKLAVILTAYGSQDAHTGVRFIVSELSFPVAASL